MSIPPLSQSPQPQFGKRKASRRNKSGRSSSPNRAGRRSRVEAATSSTSPGQSGDTYSAETYLNSTDTFSQSSQSPRSQSPSPPSNRQPSCPEPLSASAFARECYNPPPRYSRTPSSTRFENPHPGARRLENESNEECRRRLDNIFKYLDNQIIEIDEKRRDIRIGKTKGSESHLKSKAKSLDYRHTYHSKQIDSLVPISDYIYRKLLDERIDKGLL
jgi:hypothetical protein